MTVTGVDADLATLRDALMKLELLDRPSDFAWENFLRESTALDRVEAELSRLREVEESFKHLSSEYQFARDRGDHLVYREEWERFDRWQRLRDTLEEVDFVGAEGFAADMVAAAQAEASRLREERDELEDDRDSWVDQCEDARRWEAKHGARAEAAEAECARLQQALAEIEVVMTTGDEAGWRDPVGIAREALAGQPTAAEGPDTPAAPRTLSPDGKRRLPLGSEGQDAAHVTDVMLGRLDTPADTLMGCGHPASAVVTADEGTAYCTRCAAECAADSQEDKT